MDSILAERSKYFSKMLVVSHAQVGPLLVSRGEKEFLYDENGQEYLDTRNNVPILGHSDARVVEAVHLQMSKINTNTRYLNPALTDAARTVSSILPKKLCKFFFVNSGSEANDLALRLAQYHTNRTRIVAQTNAYHGNTAAVMAVSESKYRAPFCVQPDWVSLVHCPDLVGGPYTTVSEYSDEIKQVCDTHPDEIAGIIIESIVSVGGGVFQPKGYFSTAFSTIRQAGGVCIADETQVGLGRLGVWWGFELDQTEDAVPDILTMGKQLGNGFPVAAVVTTEEICNSFDNAGIEFFSTYGGSTVSCAAATSTVKAILQDNLVARAKEMGDYLLSQLQLSLGHFMPHIIKNIRGVGLYLAIHYTTGKIATNIQNTLFADFHILSTLDGPLANVMIVKPPLCITKESCDRFVGALSSILEQIQLYYSSIVSSTLINNTKLSDITRA
jgi:ethanolamine-phosphate phospho-lyase